MYTLFNVRGILKVPFSVAVVFNNATLYVALVSIHSPELTIHTTLVYTIMRFSSTHTEGGPALSFVAISFAIMYMYMYWSNLS